MYWKDAFSVSYMYRKKMLLFRVLMGISCFGPFSLKKGVSEGGSNFTKIDEISIWTLPLSRVSHPRSGNRGSGGQNTIFAFSMVLCGLNQKSDFLTRNLVKKSFSKYPGNVWKYSLWNHGWSKGGCMLQGCLPVTQDACFIFRKKMIRVLVFFWTKENFFVFTDRKEVVLNPGWPLADKSFLLSLRSSSDSLISWMLSSVSYYHQPKTHNRGNEKGGIWIYNILILIDFRKKGVFYENEAHLWKSCSRPSDPEFPDLSWETRERRRFQTRNFTIFVKFGDFR